MNLDFRRVESGDFGYALDHSTEAKHPSITGANNASRTVQATVFDIFAEHEIGRELNAMSRWLDQQRSLLSLVAADLSGHGIKETGRHGLPAEAVLRCALLKQYRQLSYVELAFHLEDSASFISFARLPLSWSPKKSVLQQTISAISAASWEAINRA